MKYVFERTHESFSSIDKNVLLMETFRLTLVFLHIFLSIFALVNFQFDHHDEDKKIVKIFDLTTKVLRIGLEHSASILVIWFSQRCGATLVRVTGFILIDDLISLLIFAMNFVLTSRTFDRNETFFLFVHQSMLIIGLIVTYRFAERIDKIQCAGKPLEVYLFRSTESESIESHVEPVAV